MPPSLASEARPALLTHLRLATRAAHQALDQHPLLRALLQAQPGLTDYARALAALHAPQALFEAQLRHDEMPLALAAMRLPALQADLAALGWTAAALRLPAPTAPAEPAGRVGVQYVLEGARLGTQAIARHLHRHLGAQAPRSFFAANPAASARWHGFGLWAAERCSSAADWEAARQAALATFAFFLAHLDDCLLQWQLPMGESSPSTQA